MANNFMTTTKQTVEFAVDILILLGDTIKLAGRIPSGQLYAQVMGCVELASYQAMIDTLKRCELVREENHVLIWNETP
jgi:hypothetical protein